MKDTVLKSVTALICVVILCITSSVAVGNYSDALKDAAKLGGETSAFDGTVDNDNVQITPDNSSDLTSDVTPDITYTTTPADDTQTSTPDSDENATVPTSQDGANDPTAYSKEQVVKYYTESVTKSYNAQKVTIKRTETIAISVDSMTPGGKGALALANKIVEAYAKTTESTKAFSKGVATDDGTYKANDFGFPVALDPKGAKTATVTKKGNNYEINIQVVAEDATLQKFPVYNKQCSFPLDLGAVDLFGLKVTQGDFSYTGTKLKATVGADGYVKQAEVYMPLAGKGGGNFIGISGAAEVSGSMKRTLTFTY